VVAKRKKHRRSGVLFKDDLVVNTAVFGGGGRYRYSLSRVWEPGLPAVCWIMLNPSRADALQNDPTIMRCVGFSHRWGFGGLVVVNLFALVATYPAELYRATEAVGLRNDAAIEEAIRCRPVICAWGNVPQFAASRVHRVRAILARTWTRASCLGLTRFGNPRHPLYVPLRRKRQTFFAESAA